MTKPFIIKKIQLERAAKRAGCCPDYRGRILRAKDDEELLDIYTKGIRFCMSRDYPSLDFSKKNFTKEEINRRGIYISENLEGKEGRHRAMVALGDCTGRLHFGDFLVCRLVAKDNAKFDITVDGHAILMADILGNASVTFHVKDNARLVAYHYGDAATPTIDTEGENTTIKVQHRKTE